MAEALGFAGLTTSEDVGVARGGGGGSSPDGVERGVGVDFTFAFRLRDALLFSFAPKSPTTLAGSALILAGLGVGMLEGWG